MKNEDNPHAKKQTELNEDRRDELAKKHELLRGTKEFKDQKKYLNRITHDFLETTQICWLMATREKNFVETSLVFRSVDDLNQSVVAIQTLIEQGMLTPARREMRYILESTVKNLYVDQNTEGYDFNNKVKYLHEQVQRSSISMVDELDLPFEDAIRTTFLGEVKGIYSRACAYIHPSKEQIEERIKLASLEAYIGFERPKDLERINAEIFRLYEVALILIFSAIGQSGLGDIFIYFLDDKNEWRYHKGKYIKVVSSIFDYKVERIKAKNNNK